MAQINDYFKRKYEAEKSEVEDYKKKLSKHRWTIILRIAIVLALVGIVVGVIVYNTKTAIYSDYDTVKTVTFTESTNADYLNLNGSVLRYSKDGASAFNMSSNMLWNQTFEMQNPMIDVCQDYVAIGDYKGARIYVLNSNGLQGEVDTTLPVQNFCVSGNGNVATVLEENEITWIKLFDKAGNLIAKDRTTMAKSGYPIKVAISNDGIMLGVSYLRIDTGTLSSSVAFYNFGAVGQNEIDNLVSGYDYPETIISEVAFMNEKTSFAVGDDRMVIFTGAQKPEVTAEIPVEDEIYSVFYSDEYIGLVFMDGTADHIYRMEVYNEKGDHVLTCEFDLEYKDIIFNNDLIVIFNNDESLIMNMQGVERFHGSFHKSIITMIPMSSQNKYMLVSGSQMEEIQLK